MMKNKEYEKVIAYIKQMISEGCLCPGDKLPAERELADRLHVGRYSIREALRIMESMGLMESRQGSGNYLVANIGKNLTELMQMMLMVKQIDYWEVSQLRRAIELYIYDSAMKKITGSKLDRMRTILKKMENTSGVEKARLDKQFHDIILYESDNTLVISIMESLSEVCQSSIEKVICNATNEIEKKLMGIHLKMLHGFLEKDSKKGNEAINEHYNLIEAIICRK